MDVNLQALELAVIDLKDVHGLAGGRGGLHQRPCPLRDLALEPLLLRNGRFLHLAWNEGRAHLAIPRIREHLPGDDGGIDDNA